MLPLLLKLETELVRSALLSRMPFNYFGVHLFSCSLLNAGHLQVQTAYKKALLTFHPDRASRSDIRKQVEAEEKFKLVNRLKAKFLPSSLQ